MNLNKVTVGEGADLITSWMENHNIKVLNVAGSRASKAPTIYGITKQILKAAIGAGKMQFAELADGDRLQKSQAYLAKDS